MTVITQTPTATPEVAPMAPCNAHGKGERRSVAAGLSSMYVDDLIFWHNY